MFTRDNLSSLENQQLRNSTKIQSCDKKSLEIPRTMFDKWIPKVATIKRAYHLCVHPQSVTHPWKMVVGRLRSYWGPVTFQGRAVKLPGNIHIHTFIEQKTGENPVNHGKNPFILSTSNLLEVCKWHGCSCLEVRKSSQGVWLLQQRTTSRTT